MKLSACAAAGGGAAASSRNLWVSGLSSTTRATDLKSLFSKYGKVGLIGTSLRSPQASLAKGRRTSSAGGRSKGGDQRQESRRSLLWLRHHVVL